MCLSGGSTLIAFFGHRVSNAGDAMSPTIENERLFL